MSEAASITWPSTPRGSASCRQARQRDRRRRRPSGREIGRPDQQSERAQGVAYITEQDLIVVASAGDGSVRFHRATNLKPVKTSPSATTSTTSGSTQPPAILSSDTAMAHWRSSTPKTELKVGDITLSGHPEAFQVEPRTHRAFVNVPDAHQVVVVDLDAEKQTAAWSTSGFGSNFPMVLGGTGEPLAVVFRSPRRSPFWTRRPGLSQRRSACAATGTKCSSTRSEAGST